MTKDEINQVAEETGMTNEEILMNEADLIDGLLEAAGFKSDDSLRKKIQIKRNGKVLFEFRVRPLEEDETQEIRKSCTKYAPNPAGRHLPRIEVETNFVRLRSKKIYEATIPEDRAILWDNQSVKKKLNCLDPLDVIDQVLMAGEKDAIVDVIDSISGYGQSVEDYAKN